MITEQQAAKLLQARLCPATAVVREVNTITGEVAWSRTPRCHRPTCPPCARLDAQQLADAVTAAQPNVALTLTQVAPDSTPDSEVFAIAEQVHRRTLRAIRTLGAFEDCRVWQRAPGGMLHGHIAGRLEPSDRRCKIHPAIAAVLPPMPRFEAVPPREVAAWATYLFGDARANLPQHLALNNAPGSQRLRLEHHTRGFFPNRPESERTQT